MNLFKMEHSKMVVERITLLRCINPNNRSIKLITDLWVSFPFSLKCMKGRCLTSFPIKQKSFLSGTHCGFRKVHRTQHTLFRLLKPWQRKLDDSGSVGTISVYLCKAYDCIPYGFLIAKWHRYGLHKNNLNLSVDYLSGRKQRTKICSAFSEW